MGAVERKPKRRTGHDRRFGGSEKKGGSESVNETTREE